MIYFQNSDQISGPSYKQDDADYKIKIMPNDNLFIKVSAVNPDAVAIFNVIQTQGGNLTNNSLDILGYLVDQKGNINLPLVGQLHVAGLTKTEALQLVQKEISKFVEDPVVNIRILNYKISILGEVTRPGVYTVTDERISIPQALALAGDLTIFGERHNVQLIRMENGEKKFYYFDLTSPDVFSSPNYYLLQNDVLYVSPNGAKVRSASTNQNISLIISLLTATITVAYFIINSKK
jgi:polysaccharide export outer membrane protein